MKALDRKLFRDLQQLKAQMAAISLVMACGVTMFVMALGAIRTLERAQNTYYESHHFAEIFAHLKRAPNALADRIVKIDGVSMVQTRIVAEVSLDVEGMVEPASGRLISMPEVSPPLLNRLFIRRGRSIEPGGRNEAVVAEPFAGAHNLEPGDTVAAVINGRREELIIVGVGLSPEFIYQIRPGELFPDDRRFGIFWVSERELGPAFNMDGAFNDLSLTLAPGALPQRVLEELDLLLEPYGGTGAYTREDQISHQYVSAELEQLRAMAVFIPGVFLAVSAFLLNTVMTRLIRTQREQIGALKAFGYSNYEIGFHFLKMVFVIVIAGTIFGVIGGAWLGRGLAQLYIQFFAFPVFTYRLEIDVVLLAVLTCGGAVTIGTLTAVFRAVRLPPAEAMRPEQPGSYRPTIIERLGLQRYLSQAPRMILRELERRPLKGALSCFGLALAVAMLVLGRFNADIIDAMVDHEFNQVQRYDVVLTFFEPVPGRGIEAVRRLPGVRRAEAFRAAPVELSAGHRMRRLSIMGLPRERELLRLLTVDRREVSLPEEGVLLSRTLAEILEVSPGDEISVKILEGRRPRKSVILAGTIDDYTGLSAYMEIQALHRLMGEGDAISGSFLTGDPLQRTAFFERIKETPVVAGATVKDAAYRSFMDTMAETLLRMQAFNVVFAGIIAFGVVYNSARISLEERSRELATLRVIGFTRAEISTLLLGELGVLTAIAIPVGLLMGYGLAALVVVGLQTETLRFPLAIAPATYSFAVVILLITVILSSLVVRRRLDHLDLIGVLKSRE